MDFIQHTSFFIETLYYRVSLLYQAKNDHFFAAYILYLFFIQNTDRGST